MSGAVIASPSASSGQAKAKQSGCSLPGLMLRVLDCRVATLLAVTKAVCLSQ